VKMIRNDSPWELTIVWAPPKRSSLPLFTLKNKEKKELPEKYQNHLVAYVNGRRHPEAIFSVIEE
jgi:hypothetical protein